MGYTQHIYSTSHPACIWEYKWNLEPGDTQDEHNKDEHDEDEHGDDGCMMISMGMMMTTT